MEQIDEVLWLEMSDRYSEPAGQFILCFIVNARDKIIVCYVGIFVDRI